MTVSWQLLLSAPFSKPGDGTRNLNCTRQDFLGTRQFFVFILPDQRLHIVKNVCVCVCVCVYIYITDCVKVVYDLPLLPSYEYTASETFLHKPGAVWSVDWIFINGAPVWRWLGEYVLKSSFKQKAVATPSYFRIFLLHSSMKPLLEI